MRSSIIIAIVLALVAGGWILSGQFGAEDAGSEPVPDARETAASAQTDAPAVSVRVTSLEARPRESRIAVTGRTEASRQVQLRAETEGQVIELLVRRGETVEADQPIARLSMADRAAKLTEAKATLRQRQIEFEAARKLHDKGFRSTTDQAASQARLDAARAVVEQIEVDIARTTIRAPFDGVIGAGHVETGDYLRVGDTVASVVDLSPILVVGNVTERQVGRVREGMAGHAELVDGTALPGAVTFVAATADPQTRTYRVELEAENPDGRIRDGITAELTIPVGEGMAHYVPPSAITLNDAGTVGVKTVDDDGTVHFRPVAVLASDAGGMWLDGLPAQVRLITVGQEFVVDGERVDAIESAPIIPQPGEGPGAS